MSKDWNTGKDAIEGEYKVIEEREAGDIYQLPRDGRYLEMNPHPPYITYILLGLNILAWLMMSLSGILFGWDINQQLFIFGAKENTLVAYGQYWRLFTAMFLHIGIMHLFFNSYALYLYGPVIERLFGRIRFIIIYLLSGLMGSVFSYVFSPNPAAGASGAIFGLMGALMYFRQRKKDIFKRVFGAGLVMIIGINLFYGFVQPGIDNWGHIGGLVGGFLIGTSVGLYQENKISNAQKLIWLLILVIFVAGLWRGQLLYGI